MPVEVLTALKRHGLLSNVLISPAPLVSALPASDTYLGHISGVAVDDRLVARLPARPQTPHSAPGKGQA